MIGDNLSAFIVLSKRLWLAIRQIFIWRWILRREIDIVTRSKEYPDGVSSRNTRSPRKQFNLPRIELARNLGRVQHTWDSF